MFDQVKEGSELALCKANHHRKLGGSAVKRPMSEATKKTRFGKEKENRIIDSAEGGQARKRALSNEKWG